MPNKFLAAILLMLLFSCKALHKNKTEYSMPAATNPGTCSIEGEIIKVIEPFSADSGSICAKYPCRAKVRILKVFGCGPAASIPPGDEPVEMQFAYTLHNTDILPGMKAHFPGLKKGDVFLATVTQHFSIGSDEEFVIYDYKME